MDLSIILWAGGMLFSLGIFAVKVGVGLGFSGMKGRGAALTLSLYLLLFVGMALLSGKLTRLLAPVLKQGPYLHIAMALGMIAWGVVLLRGQKAEHRTQNTEHRLRGEYRIPPQPPLDRRIKGGVLLLLPCPVCLTAMTFSTWSAMQVIELPAVLVGLALGGGFVVLSLGIYLFSRLLTPHSSGLTRQTGLGLAMTALGLYFLSSLFLPAKIEEAKGIYSSFVTEAAATSFNDTAGVMAVLLAAGLIGFFAKKQRKKTP